MLYIVYNILILSIVMYHSIFGKIMKIKHVLGLSGGKDSAALAVYMRENYPDIPIEYFFTDTGEELPEVYDFLGKLEAYLGQPITYLNSGKTFSYWLKKFNNFLPSQQCRWCTIQMKLEPFKKWIQPMIDDGYKIYSYVAIRVDEESRTGMLTNTASLTVKLPFREDGIDKAGVFNILEKSGLGLPAYYSWRSRSGCTFCFFQQKIEWIRLYEKYPDAFIRAMNLEKTALKDGSPFTWSQGESLADMIIPSRMAEIKKDYEQRQKKARAKLRVNPIHEDLETEDIDTLYGCQEGKGSCAFCMK